MIGSVAASPEVGVSVGSEAASVGLGSAFDGCEEASPSDGEDDGFLGCGEISVELGVAGGEEMSTSGGEKEGSGGGERGFFGVVVRSGGCAEKYAPVEYDGGFRGEPVAAVANNSGKEKTTPDSLQERNSFPRYPRLLLGVFLNILYPTELPKQISGGARLYPLLLFTTILGTSDEHRRATLPSCPSSSNRSRLETSSE